MSGMCYVHNHVYCELNDGDKAESVKLQLRGGEIFCKCIV